MHAHRRSRLTAGIAVTAVLSFAFALPAGAVNTVTQTINAGTRSASIADLSLAAVTYSHTAQSNTGLLVLTADDSSGSGAGWNVTVQGSDFVYSGTAGGSDIPAADFAITSSSAATSTAGEAIDPTGGPSVPLAFTTPATLDVAREVLEAQVNFGEGTYTQDLGVDLTIPAQARVGTYTGTMTVTISAGP